MRAQHSVCLHTKIKLQCLQSNTRYVRALQCGALNKDSNMYKKIVLLSLIACISADSIHGKNDSPDNQKKAWSLTPSLSTVYNYTSASVVTSTIIQCFGLGSRYLHAIEPLVTLATPLTQKICTTQVFGPLLTGVKPYALQALTVYAGIPFALAIVVTPSLPSLIPGGNQAKTKFKSSLINNWKNLSKPITSTLIFAGLVGLTGFLMQRYGNTTIPTV